MLPGSAIAQQMAMLRTKATEVIRDLGTVVSDKLIKNLGLHRFSIIIDKTTDNTTIKLCAVIVRYYDPEFNSIITDLLDMLGV